MVQRQHPTSLGTYLAAAGLCVAALLMPLPGGAPLVGALPPPDYHARPEFASWWNRSNWRRQRWENEWDYVDLAFKIDYSALEGPGQHLLNGVFLGLTIARETFATQFILDVHRAVNVSTQRLFVHNVTPAEHHFEDAARYVMVTFRMYSAANTTEDGEYTFSAAGGQTGSGRVGAHDRNPSYSRGGDYHEDPEAANDIKWAEDATWRLGDRGELSTVEAISELSDQAQNKDSLLLKMGNVTNAIDPQWGLISLDWDLSLRLAYTIGIIDGSLRGSESYVADPFGGDHPLPPEEHHKTWGSPGSQDPTATPTGRPTGGPTPLPTTHSPTDLPTAAPSGTPSPSSETWEPSLPPSPLPSRTASPSADPTHLPSQRPTPVPTSLPTNGTVSSFAAGGGSGRGAATGEVEAFSDVLWLNQGADRYCEEEERAPLVYGVDRRRRSAYCEFEYFFREDIATALNISTSRVLVLLMKAAARDHSLVYFRLLPPTDVNQTSTHFLIADLQDQTQRLDSALYNGNVTIRVDSSWGVSGFGRKVKTKAPYLPYDVDLGSFGSASAYERCRVTRRCARAKEHYNITAGTKRFSYQAFDGGRHFEQATFASLPQDASGAEGAAAASPAAYAASLSTNAARQLVASAMAAEVAMSGGGALGGSGGRVGLFADFEDWHVGSHGWRQRGGAPPVDPLKPPSGAHFSPMAFDPLGPSVPTAPPAGREFGQSRGAQRQSDDGTVTDSHLHYHGQDFDRFQNRGLVLNNRTFARDLQTQRRLLRTLEGDRLWHEDKRQAALMDAELRSRVDVDRFMTKRLNNINARIAFEQAKTAALEASQCDAYGLNPNRLDGCRLLFNTSDATLRGAINVRGVVALSPGGQPCAVFTFDSIELGPEVNVTLVGQRPLVLLSRSSVMINTTFAARPATLGGFQGGFSWGRRPSDALSDDPADLHLRHLPTEAAEPRAAFMDDDNVAEGYRAGMASSGGGGEDTFSRDSTRAGRANESTASNNVNGPGSGSVRNYQYTVTTTAADVDEVQVVTTSADDGQQLGGGFRLHYLKGRFSTQRIAWDASAAEVKRIVEADLNPLPVAELPHAVRTERSALPVSSTDGREASSSEASAAGFLAGVGVVDVSRGTVDENGGYAWAITFRTATGDVPQLEATNLLSGMGSFVEVTTRRDGNSIRGTWQLRMFGRRTAAMPHDATAREVKMALEAAMAGPLLRAHVWRNDATSGHCGGSGGRDDEGNAYHDGAEDEDGADGFGGFGARAPPEGSGNPVSEEYAYSDLDGRMVRSDPFCQAGTPLPLASRCNDGLCPQGPTPGGGFTWTLLLTTLVGNVSPLSPTSSDAWRQAKRDELEAEWQGAGEPWPHRPGFLGGGEAGKLTGEGVALTVRRGHGASHLDQLRAFSVDEPFSLAYGGGGGGYGGAGGVGFNGSAASGFLSRRGQPYGDGAMSRGLLLGGSGGQLGYAAPSDVATFTNPTGRGGDGGGAIEVVAVNDIILGSYARITANGGRGRDGHRGGGGGGSGGSVLLVAGGVAHLECGARIEARGGDGGRTGGQPHRTSQAYQRRYGGAPGDGFTARDFDGSADDGSYAVPLGLGGRSADDRTAPGGGVRGSLTAKQERQLANLAKGHPGTRAGGRGSEKGKRFGGASARHVASMRAKMLGGMSFTDAHAAASREEDMAQQAADAATHFVDRPGGGGGGGRVALFAHGASLATHRALLRTDWAADREAGEAGNLLSGGGVPRSTHARPGGDTGDAQRNGGDGGARADSSWRPRDGARGSGSNRSPRGGPWYGGARGGAGGDGSRYRGTGTGHGGYAVYDVGGGRCLQRLWAEGKQNGTWAEHGGFVNGTQVTTTHTTTRNGSVVYLGPNETAVACAAHRQGSAGTFHLELDVGVALQVAERGYDDYADAVNASANYDPRASQPRSSPLSPGGPDGLFNGGTYHPPGQAGFDFDGYAGGSGGAGGTRRALRLDGATSEWVVTASGVQQRRPFAFDGVEHDLLGAWETAAAEAAALGAVERRVRLRGQADETRGVAEALRWRLDNCTDASAVLANCTNATATATNGTNATAPPRVGSNCTHGDPRFEWATRTVLRYNCSVNATEAAREAAAAAVEAAATAAAAANASAADADLFVEEAAAAAALSRSGAQFAEYPLYKGSHRPSRLSFFVKVNGSDDFSDRHFKNQFAGAEPSKRRQGSWGVLVALHSADYGRRTGFDGLGAHAPDVNASAADASSSSVDPFERFGYFAHTKPGFQGFEPAGPGGGLGGGLGDATGPNPDGFRRRNRGRFNASSSSSSGSSESGRVGGAWGCPEWAPWPNGTNATGDALHNVTGNASTVHWDGSCWAAWRDGGGQDWPDVRSERAPRVLVGVAIGADFRHGTDFLVAPDELVHPLAPASVDPASARRRTRSGAGHESVPGDAFGGLPVLEPFAQERRWYKVDVLLDWQRRTYSIRLDDERKVDGAPFSVGHNQALRLGIYTTSAVTAWVDEVYVGPDTTRQFETPKVTGTGVDMARPRQTNGWTADDIGGVTTLHPMTRHESHLSRRRVYQFDNTQGDASAEEQFGGKRRLIPFDGDGHRMFHSDVHERRPRGHAFHRPTVTDVEGSYGHLGDGGHLDGGRIHAGTLLYVKGHRAPEAQHRRAATSATNDMDTARDGRVPKEVGQSWSFSGRDRRSGYRGYMDGSRDLGEPRNGHGGASGRYYWYGEHYKGPSGEAADGSGYGGIFAMSSSDLVSWRHEGLMLDFRNLTDMVNGPPPRGARLVADRPKVVFNNKTQLYVMFMHLEYAHDTDPSDDNSGGGYGYPLGRGDDGMASTRRAGSVNGPTDSAIPAATGSAFYPGSNGERAAVEAASVAAAGETGAGHAGARLFEGPGTDGGLTAAATTWGSSPNGDRPTRIAQATRDAKGGFGPPTHSDRGSDGIGAGVGEGLDVERGHFQEHNWVRRRSLRGNWTGGQLGMAAVATSQWPNGPFDFRRSFYPDGNKTKDQTVFAPSQTGPVASAAAGGVKDAVSGFDSGEAFLGRTYYANVEYVLPLAVMQPIWESVKRPGARDERHIDHALTYHRSFYEADYDKFHDTYLQRWRLEDKLWSVVCVNRTDGAVRPVDREVSGGWFTAAASATPGAAWELPEGAVCVDPDEYKVILGQGWPPIPSRFLDPRDPKNNEWRPSSVPSVQAQDWWHNYRNGACGIRKLDDDLDGMDVLLEQGAPNTTAEGRAHCSNIADNPLHATPADLLTGRLAVVETRRAKYVAVSRLTDDFLDTSSLLQSFEGELEDEADMVSLLTGFGSQFGWAPGSQMGSTFHAPVDSSAQPGPDTSARGAGGKAGSLGFEEFRMSADTDTRMHQYERAFGDRAEFSLACVLDGSCTVNFRDQVVDPSGAERVNDGEALGRFETFSGAPSTGSQDFRSSFTGRK